MVKNTPPQQIKCQTLITAKQNPCSPKTKFNATQNHLLKRKGFEAQSFYPLFAFLLVFTFFIFNNLNLYAQVKIKEKVEIKPKLNFTKGKGTKNSTATNDYLPCGPWKKVMILIIRGR